MNFVEIQCYLGDITTAEVEAIVNAANPSLLGGGGVDGAIHRAAGPELLAACRELRATSLPKGLPVGAAVASPGFRLPARWVIHTVGPNWHAGQRDPAQLASCFTSSLDVAADMGARSVAFPAVSAGVYGWSEDDVSAIAIEAVRDWGQGHAGSTPSDVRFVLFNEVLLAAFDRAAQ